ncbi:MAG: serine hydrolase domain-containing protein [Pseudonocardiaceae bacterium]
MLPTTEFALLHRIATEQATNRAPSLVAAIVRNGEIAWSGARGTVDGDTPDNDTQYRLGSITKPFIAVLVMRLRDEGTLDLDDRLEQHLPGTAFGHLTIAQLLSHTSGMTAESPGPWWERSVGGNWDALNASLSQEAIKLRPGQRFHYSNVGYGVLGELVARKRGRSWLDALRAEILAPLGMNRTSPHPEGRHAKGWAVHPFADVLLPEPATDTGAMAPAGQLWSTVHDLARWTSFIGGHTGEVLRPQTVAEMCQVAAVDDGDAWTAGYGLGFQVLRHHGGRFAGHGGSMPGFLACSMINPATQTGALLMANTTSGIPIMTLALDLITIADEHEPPLPAQWQPSPAEPAALALTGLWHWGPAPFHLRLLPNGWLDLYPAGGKGRASRFRPLGDDSWQGLDGYYTGETLRVERAADGSPEHLNLATFIFTRTPYDPAAPIPGGVDEGGWRA